MPRPDPSVLAAELVAECEAFLSGRYAEVVAARGTAVPVWAWMNLLAHGTEADLRGAAAAIGASGASPWDAARARLAGELLGACSLDCPLEELQRAVLAPLQLSLASRDAVERWDRRTWIDTVRAAVRAYRPTSRS